MSPGRIVSMRRSDPSAIQILVERSTQNWNWWPWYCNSSPGCWRYPNRIVAGFAPAVSNVHTWSFAL